jgi:hypothetical protein
MKRTLTYLAAPYSHKDHHMMVVRFLAINQYAAKLMSRGDYIFSPISHTHPIAEAGINMAPRSLGDGTFGKVMTAECCLAVTESLSCVFRGGSNPPASKPKSRLVKNWEFQLNTWITTASHRMRQLRFQSSLSPFLHSQSMG